MIVDPTEMRELMRKLGHAECIRIGEPTNRDRFLAAAIRSMPALLKVYEAAATARDAIEGTPLDLVFCQAIIDAVDESRAETGHEVRK